MSILVGDTLYISSLQYCNGISVHGKRFKVVNKELGFPFSESRSYPTYEEALSVLGSACSSIKPISELVCPFSKRKIITEISPKVFLDELGNIVYSGAWLSSAWVCENLPYRFVMKGRGSVFFFDSLNKSKSVLRSEIEESVDGCTSNSINPVIMDYLSTSKNRLKDGKESKYKGKYKTIIDKGNLKGDTLSYRGIDYTLDTVENLYNAFLGGDILFGITDRLIPNLCSQRLVLTPSINMSEIWACIKYFNPLFEEVGLGVLPYREFEFIDTLLFNKHQKSFMSTVRLSLKNSPEIPFIKKVNGKFRLVISPVLVREGIASSKDYSSYSDYISVVKEINKELARFGLEGYNIPSEEEVINFMKGKINND